MTMATATATQRAANQIPLSTVKLFRSRPDIFIERATGTYLWSKQREILQSVWDNERTAVKSCHGPGKTKLAADAAVAFLMTHKPAEVITTAPTWRQVRRQLWKEVNLTWGRLPDDLRALGTCLTTEIQIGPGHVAYGLSTDDPDMFQGIHSPHLMVIVDEANGVDDEIYAAIDTLGAGGKYRELLIGNPTRAEGKFYRAFQNPALGYNCISIPVDVTPNWTGEDVPDEVRRVLVNPERVAQWATDWGKDSPMYLSRVKAEFPTGADSNVLIPLAWLEAAQNRATEGYEPHGDPQMGVDVARYGSNRTAIAKRIGPALTELDSWPSDTSVPQVAGLTKEHAEAMRQGMDSKVKLLVLIDDGGVGGGVVDILKPQSDGRIEYKGVNFGESASDKEHFINRRAEMYCHLRDLARQGNNDPDLVIAATSAEAQRFAAQVSAMKYEFDAKGKRKIESKENMEKRKLPSPDEADAVVLAFAPTERGGATLGVSGQGYLARY